MKHSTVLDQIIEVIVNKVENPSEKSIKDCIDNLQYQSSSSVHNFAINIVNDVSPDLGIDTTWKIWLNDKHERQQKFAKHIAEKEANKFEKFGYSVFEYEIRATQVEYLQHKITQKCLNILEAKGFQDLASLEAQGCEKIVEILESDNNFKDIYNTLNSVNNLLEKAEKKDFKIFTISTIEKMLLNQIGGKVSNLIGEKYSAVLTVQSVLKDKAQDFGIELHDGGRHNVKNYIILAKFLEENPDKEQEIFEQLGNLMFYSKSRFREIESEFTAKNDSQDTEDDSQDTEFSKEFSLVDKIMHLIEQFCVFLKQKSHNDIFDEWEISSYNISDQDDQKLIESAWNVSELDQIKQ